MSELAVRVADALFLWGSLPEPDLCAAFASAAEDSFDGDTFQAEVVRLTVHSNVYRLFPPDPETTLRFLKRLVLLLEAHVEEVHPALYAEVARLSTADGCGVRSGGFFKSYFGGLSAGRPHLVSLVERKELIGSGTTGLRTWEAGLFLYEWLVGRKDTLGLEDAAVLELGSGVGFTGIALAKSGSVRRLVMTDHNDLVLETLYRNAQFNLSGLEEDDDVHVSWPRSVVAGGSSAEHQLWKDRPGSILVDRLDWESFCDGEEAAPVGSWPDLVLGADVAFDSGAIPHLCRVLAAALSRGKARSSSGAEGCAVVVRKKTAVIASVVRDEATDAFFAGELVRQGLRFRMEVHSSTCGKIRVPLHLYVVTNNDEDGDR